MEKEVVVENKYKDKLAAIAGYLKLMYEYANIELAGGSSKEKAHASGMIEVLESVQELLAEMETA